MYSTASDATQIDLEELVSTASIQQQTLAFLIAKWRALLGQPAAFGPSQAFVVDSNVPQGVWYCVNPLSGQIGTQTVSGNLVPVAAPGPFASGTGLASVRTMVPCTLAPVLDAAALAPV